MITLVSDEAALTGDFVLPDGMSGADRVWFRGPSFLKYWFKYCSGEQELASDWLFLMDAPEPRMTALIDDFRSMRKME